MRQLSNHTKRMARRKKTVKNEDDTLPVQTATHKPLNANYNPYMEFSNYTLTNGTPVNYLNIINQLPPPNLFQPVTIMQPVPQIAPPLNIDVPKPAIATKKTPKKRKSTATTTPSKKQRTDAAIPTPMQIPNPVQQIVQPPINPHLQARPPQQHHQLSQAEQEIIQVLTNPDLDPESLYYFCVENTQIIHQLRPDIATRMRQVLAKGQPAPSPHNPPQGEPMAFEMVPKGEAGTNDLNAPVASSTGFERALSQDEIDRLPDNYRTAYLEGKFDPVVFRDFALLNGLIAPSAQEQDTVYVEFSNLLGSTNVTDMVTKCILILKQHEPKADVKELILGVNCPAPFAAEEEEEDDDDEIVFFDPKQGRLQELDRNLARLRESIKPYVSSENVVKKITQIIEKVWRTTK